VCFAVGDDLLQGLDRLLDRDRPVEPVRLIEVDVVGLQPRQRGVDLLGDLRAGQTAVVGVIGHLTEDLCREDVGVPWATREDLAPRRLGGATTVYVGRVEEIDAGRACASMPHENLIGGYLRARRELIHPAGVGVSDLNSRRRVRGAGRGVRRRRARSRTRCPSRRMIYALIQRSLARISGSASCASASHPAFLPGM
jgi:hypothetical protein